MFLLAMFWCALIHAKMPPLRSCFARQANGQWIAHADVAWLRFIDGLTPFFFE